MSQGDIVAVAKDAVYTALLMASPFLLASLAIGLIISVLQAATQIHEQNISFVPKIVAVALLMVMLGSWLMTQMTEFTTRTLANIASMM
jgi:flagellar biosynthetic protein FliQ